MVAVRVPRWGLSIGEAKYYGWLVCLHLGPWLIFAVKCEPEP
jgi:hypothetical protein